MYKLLKDPKFKICDIVGISKYKNIFAKGYITNWSRDIFVIKKVKNFVPWSSITSDTNGEKILRTFMKKNCKKQFKKLSDLKK